MIQPAKSLQQPDAIPRCPCLTPGRRPDRISVMRLPKGSLAFGGTRKAMRGIRRSERARLVQRPSRMGVTK